MRVRIATGLAVLPLVFFGADRAGIAIAGPPQTLPTLPGANDGVPNPGQTQLQPMASVHAATTDKVRKGVVSVEQAGRIIALGTVLGSDGRVLTSLTGLAGAVEADVRFSDNHVVHAKIGHKDPVSDLALLVPVSG